MRFTTLCLAAAAIGASACARTAGRELAARAMPAYDHSALTAAELGRMPNAANLLEAVRYMRPLFLRPRPGSYTVRGRAPTLAVYINDSYAGGVDVLTTIPPSIVERARYLQRSEAMLFAGTNTPGDGFIMVTLKKVVVEH